MNKAIFWDLQGTLGGDAVASIELFEPYPFAKDALKLAKDNGYRNIVITNQSLIKAESVRVVFWQKYMKENLNVLLAILIRMKYYWRRFSAVHIRIKTSATAKSLRRD